MSPSLFASLHNRLSYIDLYSVTHLIATGSLSERAADAMQPLPMSIFLLLAPPPSFSSLFLALTPPPSICFIAYFQTEREGRKRALRPTDCLFTSFSPPPTSHGSPSLRHPHSRRFFNLRPSSVRVVSRGALRASPDTCDISISLM